MEVYELPDSEWAKFKCSGPLPGAMQTINTKIYKEWLPGNAEYELSFPADIEWYSNMNNQAPDYESAIWMPVKRKK